MANPRQRRKARSGKYSGATKSAKRAQNKRLKRAPTVMGPDILRENWDPTLTVRQNYAKLGLVPSLAQQSGGLDRNDPYNKAAMSSQAPAESENSRPRKGMARVIRDEKGRVVDIVEYEEEAEEADTKTPWGDTLNQDEDEPANLTMLPPRLHEGKEGATVQALEKLSSEDKPVPRFTSVAEHQWLVELICAHGTDVQAMARDRKRNVWQKTAGEIKRAIRKAGLIDL
ncbi:Nucleolar protein 16 [Malassezia pachydermatis]|uniref:Nucleolar protein 16 n=1 Tax=Malassezia pachydermatis TaxID=77020 RepID=A0A0M8MLU9_9BASI|nr:hypothetical protein Malapachy_1326 [Malassezia pachydermatis]KOS12727.1 hypothetical protein Malapachy_1326 [Malassezia pachydermatis]